MNEITQTEHAKNAVLLAERRFIIAMRSTFEQGLELGRALNEAKRLIPHGGFESFCEEACKIKRTQRSKLMQLAENYPNIHSSGVLDINTEYKLLGFDDSEPSGQSDRDFLRDQMQDMTQRERSGFLDRITQLEAAGENWRSEAEQYRAELEQAKAALSQKKTAGQPDKEAIKQIVETANERIRAAEEKHDKLLNNFRQNVEIAVQNREQAREAELKEYQGRLIEAQVQAQQAERDYGQIAAKKSRIVEIQAESDKLRSLLHEASISTTEIFFGDGGWTPEQVSGAVKWMRQHIEIYRQAIALVEAAANGAKANDEALYAALSVDDGQQKTD